ncbi:unnamed protein product [Psylliodes chrysocephalus]|uniref:Uncharacterized protein n=1 Tax=Psylliodes chrysocephalus TaxID=3402493 RepID=A0A9P0GA59_9CUCU|nr:unnamed protein product [Psylliodes chrysocephala]
MPFAVPMVWREPKDHVTDCYFCLTNVKGIGPKSKHTVRYCNLPSALRPVKHSEQFPIPKALESWSLDEELESTGSLGDVTETAKEMTTDPLFDLPGCSTAPHLISQGELNDLVQNLSLLKSQSEFLASRLKGQKHDPRDWPLFIDSSKLSLKAVLVHNGNEYSSVPLAHAVNMKESYENMRVFLEYIRYQEYGWAICGDLKLSGTLSEDEKTDPKLLTAYKEMGCNVALKIHFLDSHLDFFPENLRAVSDEHGERFYQDISAMEKRYQGSLIADLPSKKAAKQILFGPDPSIGLTTSVVTDLIKEYSLVKLKERWDETRNC